jgi:hypothetical protein
VLASARVRLSTLILPPEARFGVSYTKPPATNIVGNDVIVAVYPHVSTDDGCVKGMENGKGSLPTLMVTDRNRTTGACIWQVEITVHVVGVEQ